MAHDVTTPTSFLVLPRGTRPVRLLPLLLAALALVPGAGLAEAQEGPWVQGAVVEQGTLTPVPGALISAFHADDERFEAVAVTRSDADGVFELELPRAGHYRFQADNEGSTSPLSEVVEVGDEAEPVEVVLLVPSPLLALAYACQAEAGDDAVAVVGIVRDPVGEIPLPDARVEVRWQEEGEARAATGTSDASGRYRICGIPPRPGFLQMRGDLLGRMSAMEEVEISGPTFIFHDVELTLGASAPRSANVIQERILMEAAARTLGDVGGQLLDQFTEAPIQQAVVRLRGTPLQALTGEDGRFAFEGVQPGNYVVEIRHLSYNVETDEVEVPGGQDLFLRLRVAPQAVELAGIDVTTRSAVEEITRLTPFRRDILYGEAMRLEEERGATAQEVLRRASPGLQVQEVYQAVGPPIVCVQTNRRVQSLSGGGCQMVQLIVDGARISASETGDFLRTLPASEIESVEFIPPTQATTQFGTGGNVANGVVIIYTRGRGPYVSPLRNRPPGE